MGEKRIVASDISRHMFKARPNPEALGLCEVQMLKYGIDSPESPAWANHAIPRSPLMVWARGYSLKPRESLAHLPGGHSLDTCRLLTSLIASVSHKSSGGWSINP